MVLILPTLQKFNSDSGQTFLSGSSVLCCLSNNSREIDLVYSVNQQEKINLQLSCSIQDILAGADLDDASVLLIGSEFHPYLSAELIKEINERAPDISILLFVDETEAVDNILHFFELGIAETISNNIDLRLFKKKLGLHETISSQRRQLQKMNYSLQQSNQQLEEYVYIVSHDLKAPLRGLSSLADFIREEIGTSVSSELLEMLKLMQSRTDRMQQMIDGILHYSRVSGNCSEKEQVDTKELINNVIDLIGSDLSVRYEFPDKLPVLEAERVKIFEVFQNLILNAIKHNDNQEIRVKIDCIDEGAFYRFSLTDNGKGIRPEHLTKIFGFFQTLQPKDKLVGNGLGLTIVKKIVEQQGGIITVVSNPGTGSTFSFTWKK